MPKKRYLSKIVCCGRYLTNAYDRDVQHMAHTPIVAHFMIRCGILHSCDKNKVNLEYSLFLCAFNTSCTSFLANVV